MWIVKRPMQAWWWNEEVAEEKKKSMEIENKRKIDIDMEGVQEQ